MFSPPQGPDDENSPSFQPIDLYPWVYLLPNGNLFVHSRTTSRILSNPTQANPAWSTSFYQTVSRVPRTYPRQGSAVLLPLRPPDYKPQILITGGAGAKWPDPTGAATNTVEKLDLSAAAPAWAAVAPMNYPRVLQDAVLLPDGKVFVVCGSACGGADDGIAPVLTPELYDPAANTWTKLCPMRVPRGYHSTALLLPDGRVMVAGKDGAYQTEPYHYLKSGLRSSARRACLRAARSPRSPA